MSNSIRLVHFVYTRWDRWTACGISKSWFNAEHGNMTRRTTGVVKRITCPRCQRIVGTPDDIAAEQGYREMLAHPERTVDAQDLF